MASNQKVIREYLVSLGYRVDGGSERKLDTSLHKTNLNVAALAKTVLGVAAAASALVTRFAWSMEKLYYSSRRAESTVGNLQAIGFAAKTIGLTSEGMVQAVEGMARAMRLNPGLQSLVESFGIKVTGRDKADVAIDLLDSLRKMPFYVAAQYGNLFGFGPDDLLLLFEGLDKLKEMAALRKEMAKDAGVDADAAARASVEYQNLIRSLTERIGLLRDSLAVALLPAAEEFAKYLEKQVMRLTQWVNTNGPKRDWEEGKRFVQENFWGWKGTGEFFENMKKRLLEYGKKPDTPRGPDWKPQGSAPGPAPGNNDDSLWARFMRYGGAKAYQGPRTSSAPQVPALGTAAAPSGGGSMVDSIKLWTKEGVELFYDDLKGGAQFNSPETMARVLASMQMPTSQVPSSVAAAPVIIKQDTTIHVSTSDPETAGARVASAQVGVSEAAAAILRNQKGGVR